MLNDILALMIVGALLCFGLLAVHGMVSFYDYVVGNIQKNSAARRR